MIKAYALQNNVLHPQDVDLATGVAGAVWFDLHNPTAEEEAAVQAIAGCTIPTEADMQEIEISSRLYSIEDTTFMTAILPANSDNGDPVMGPVSFILNPAHLITVRHTNPRVFATFPPRALATRLEMSGSVAVLIALLEAVIDRQADILERAAAEIDLESRALFKLVNSRKSKDYQDVLEKIGQMGNLNSNIRDSLLTLDRLAAYLVQVLGKHDADAELHERARTLLNDVKSLADHANFVASKITFLLDATLGMINIEQTNISKILSVAAVILLPATLIASIFGMNFAVMPGLDWVPGFWVSLGVMAGLAVLTFAYFKYKHWL